MSAQSAGSLVQTLQTVHERLHVAADFLKVLSILMFSPTVSQSPEFKRKNIFLIHGKM